MRRKISAIETLRNAKKCKEEGGSIDLEDIQKNSMPEVTSKFLDYKNDTNIKEKNRCMTCDNGRLYIYCTKDSNWKEKEVCLHICSSGRRNKCHSWRLHIDGNPIIIKRSKRDIQKEKEKEKKEFQNIIPSSVEIKPIIVKRKVDSKYKTKKRKKFVCPK